MTPTTQADLVREYCKVHIIDPARAQGDQTVVIRAGDVHDAVGLKNRFPLVCAALGARVFEDSENIERISVDGPLNGASTTFTFRLK